MIKLTKNAQKALKNTEVQMKIALDCKRTLQSVTNWVNHGHENLTKLSTIRSICKHTKLTINEIFEK